MPDVLAWLRSSGIQCGAGPDRGGVFGWVDESTGRPSYLYTEATGYLITLLANLSTLDTAQDYRTAAIAAGDWISSVARQPDDRVLTRRYDDTTNAHDPFDFRHGTVVFFDTCTAAYGLLNLYRMTGAARYLDDVCAIGKRCVELFIGSDYRLKRVLAGKCSNGDIGSPIRWSRECGSFNVKAAMMFAELDRITGDPQYRRIIDELIRNAVDRQMANGRFITFDRDRSTHLHPHCYTAEGLLFLSRRYSREDLFDAAWRAIDFAFRNCLSSEGQLVHSWPIADNYSGSSLRSDAVAQCLRLYYVAKLIEPACAADWEADLGRIHQLMDAFVLPSGGTSYGLDAGGNLIPHSNSWCQFFRLEMELFRHCLESGSGLPAGELIVT